MSTDDELLSFRAEFPQLERSVYMVSHSLGAMPKRAHADLAEYARLWSDEGINAWDAWVPEFDRAADRIGRVIGAEPGTVVIQTNVSTAEAVVASCLDYTKERPKVVYTALNFPSVSYVWQAEARRGAEVCVVPSDDGISVDTARLCEAIDERTLIVPISHVLFRSSTLQDVRTIVARAHEVGALVLLDCYQSAGIVPFSVADLGVDFACGGSVKWLCGGPGCGYLYVRRDLHARMQPRLTGWWGHRSPFTFEMPAQEYADTHWRFYGGTPAVGAFYQARAGADIVAAIGVDRIRAKSLRQTGRIIAACDAAGYRLHSLRDPQRRGGTVCFDFPGADQVAKALNQGRFFCDHRPGTGIRMSPHFYSTDAECDRFLDEVARLKARLA